MSKNVSALLLVIVISLAILSACGESTPTETPTADPIIARQDQVATEMALTAGPTVRAAETQRAQAIASLSPQFEPSPTRPDRIITRTPTPTFFLFDADDPFGSTILPTEWLTHAFTATDGTTYTMETFTESWVVVQVLNTSCVTCLVQQRAIREVAQLFHDEQRPYTVVYISLNVDTRVTQRALTNWAERNSLHPSVELGWVVASATPDLIQSMSWTFGERSIDPDSQTIIVVEPDGVSHLNRRGALSASEVRDMLVTYVDPPQPENSP